MAKSTKLITASYIISYIAAQSPKLLNTDHIAEMVEAHPARVRHITSRLVKAGLLQSFRGGTGGLKLAKPATEITLKDVYDAIQENPLLSFGMHDPFSKWGDHCYVHKTFEKIYSDIEEKMLVDMENIKVSDLYK